MNQEFSTSAEGVMQGLACKMVQEVKSNTDKHIQKHVDGVIKTLSNYATNIGLAHKDLVAVKKSIVIYNNELKVELTNKIREYDETAMTLFKKRRSEWRLYYLGVIGGIATPLVLFLRWLFWWVQAFFN